MNCPQVVNNILWEFVRPTTKSVLEELLEENWMNGRPRCTKCHLHTTKGDFYIMMFKTHQSDYDDDVRGLEVIVRSKKFGPIIVKRGEKMWIPKEDPGSMPIEGRGRALARRILEVVDFGQLYQDAEARAVENLVLQTIIKC
jgi:hypothetical protein